MDEIIALRKFVGFQDDHILLMNKAKLLLLRKDQECNLTAEKIIIDLLKRTKEQKQLRPLGAERILLGELRIFQGKDKLGFKDLKKGFKLLKKHPEVRKKLVFELKSILNNIYVSSKFHEKKQFKRILLKLNINLT